MYDLLYLHPWLMAVALGVLVPVVGIIFGTVTSYLENTHRAEIEMKLKEDMLGRGMSATEIQMVISATADRSKKRKRDFCQSSPVR
jgi:hypothetical protein